MTSFVDHVLNQRRQFAPKKAAAPPFLLFVVLSVVASILAASGVLVGGPAAAQRTVSLQQLRNAAKAAPDLNALIPSLPSAARVPVIVKMSAKSSERLLASLKAPLGPTVLQMHVRPLDANGTFVLSLTRGEIEQLLQNPDVEHISPDRSLHACEDYATQTVGANLAWQQGIVGGGVAVAVLDTGVAPHADLGGSTRIVGWTDLVNGRTAPYDDNGHGTHVAGIVAGDGTVSIQNRYRAPLTRIAPMTSIVGVKVLDQSGSGSVSTVIAGINWCIDHQSQYNIQVLNLSMGSPVVESYRTDPLCQACERAWSAGILVVCAAGNMGRLVPQLNVLSPPAYGTIVAPGNDPTVLTVGASNTQGTLSRSDDQVASYSSRGPSAIDFVLKPDIVAPGNQIDSLAALGSQIYNTYPANRIDPASRGGTGPTAYMQLSGTSMACPVVSGAAALLLQADPSLTPDDLKARLMVSATKSLLGDPLSCGAGYLNVTAALQSRVGAPSGASSPQVYLLGMLLVEILPAPTSSGILWGDNLIWGDNTVAKKTVYGSSDWNAGSIWTAPVWLGGPAWTGPYNTDILNGIQIRGD